MEDKNTEKTEEKKAKKEEDKTPPTTLRGVRRRARAGKKFEGRVRTRAGYKVAARIRNGVVEVMGPDNKWEEYPEGGKNLDPGWSPTPKGTMPGGVQ